MKVYADTSVFGGAFDEEFAEDSQRFFAELRTGRFELVVSALIEEEIKSAPKEVQALFDEFSASAIIRNQPGSACPQRCLFERRHSHAKVN